jgi:hypothetical protein
MIKFLQKISSKLNKKTQFWGKNILIIIILVLGSSTKGFMILIIPLLYVNTVAAAE